MDSLKFWKKRIVLYLAPKLKLKSKLYDGALGWHVTLDVSHEGEVNSAAAFFGPFSTRFPGLPVGKLEFWPSNDLEFARSGAQRLERLGKRSEIIHGSGSWFCDERAVMYEFFCRSTRQG